MIDLRFFGLGMASTAMVIGLTGNPAWWVTYTIGSVCMVIGQYQKCKSKEES